MKPNPSVLLIVDDTYFGPGSTLPEGVSRIVLGPGGSLHGIPPHLLPAIVQSRYADLAYREQQTYDLRVLADILGYSEDKVQAVLDEAGELLVRSRREAIALPHLPMSAIQALDKAVRKAKNAWQAQHAESRAWTTEQVRLNEQMRWYAQRGTDKALQVFVNERLHSSYRATLPVEPVVDAEALRRLRARRKHLARIAKQSRRRNRG